VVAPRGKHQQRFAQGVHGIVEHQFPQLFGQRRATGLAREFDGAPLRAKGLGEAGDVGGFARAVDAFKGDEKSGGLHEGWGGSTVQRRRM